MGEERTFTQVLMRPKRVHVLQYLLEHPEQEYTINELAEKTDVSYKTVQHLVETLGRLNILRVRKKGAYNLVTLNKKSSYLPMLRELGSLDARPLREAAKEYAQELVQERDAVTGIVLFGSVARGTPHLESDVDVLILVKTSAEDVEKDVHALADRFAREHGITITPLIMERKTFLAELKQDSPLEKRIKEEGILLAGETPW